MPATPERTTGCSPTHRFRCKVVLATLSTVVLISGFSWSLSDVKMRWGFWPLPWSTWAMFTWDNDLFSQLVVEGVLEDGRKVPVEMRRWFKYPVSFHQLRYNEISRYPYSIRRLARYVCHRYNEEAPLGQRIVRITISDVSWPREKGRRPLLEEVPDSKKVIHVYADATPCQSGEMR